MSWAAASGAGAEVRGSEPQPAQGQESMFHLRGDKGSGTLAAWPCLDDQHPVVEIKGRHGPMCGQISLGRDSHHSKLITLFCKC